MSVPNPAALPVAPPSKRADRREHRSGRPIGWIEKTLAGIAGNIERAVFTEQHARLDGMAPARGSAGEAGDVPDVVLAASFTSSYLVLVLLYAVTLAAAMASRIPSEFFVRRVWLGIPLFAGIVVIPSIFFVPGPRLFEIAIGPLVIAPSITGILGALLLVIAGRGERVAGGAPGDDDAVGRHPQEPPRSAGAPGVRADPLDDLPLHLPVPAHGQRDLPRPEEPDRGADERGRAASLDRSGPWVP